MSKQDDFFDKAANAADEKVARDKERDDADWWNFEGKGGDEAMPEFRGFFEAASYIEKIGDTGPYMCVMVYLRDLEGVLWKAWLSAGAAVRGISDAAPAVGSLTMIRYEGKMESSTSNRKYKAYSIVTDTQSAELWASYSKALHAKPVPVGSTTAAPVLGPDEAPF